MCSVNS
ncbi:hypothetical protein CP09DC78_1138A, partial [Chlamydia psittaci 09DC78]